MSKEAYYFSHDANAQDDPKCLLLIDQLGMEGFGIFWALVEKLRNEKTYHLPLVVLGAYAKRWGTSREKVEAVVKNYGLFIIDGDEFYSPRLKSSMQLRSDKARLSASYRWNDATALRPHTDGNANGMRNDANKGKEKKGKEKKDTHGKDPKTEQPLIPGIGDAHASPSEKNLKDAYRALNITDIKIVAKWVADHKPTFIEPYVAFWNLFARERKLPEVLKLNNTRTRKFAIRSREASFDFVAILRKASHANFALQGNWFTFDWIIENETNYLKVLEGNYVKKTDLKNGQQHTSGEGEKLSNAIKKIEEQQTKS